MNARRIVAIAAIALLLVPSLAVGSSLVFGPRAEQIVEGHTVFTVLEKARFRNATVEAAAVAILVRDRSVSSSRFKGVLWFNDQFVVSPGGGRGNSVSYPCGGAVLAVNAGSPNPLLSMPPASADATRADVSDGDFELAVETAFAAEDPVAIAAALEEPRDVQTNVFEYVHSYLVTDPNDHSWIVDKYNATTTITLELPTGNVTTVTTYPVWVGNLFGHPTFVKRTDAAKCGPFVDDPWQQAAINSNVQAHDRTICDRTVATDNADGTDDTPDLCPSDAPGAGADANGDGIPVDGLDARPPAIGYYEPTDDAAHGGPAGAPSYCYEGNENTQPMYDHDPALPNGTRDDPRHGGTGCDHGNTWRPAIGGPSFRYVDLGTSRAIPHTLRLYNALLYFFIGPDDIVVTHYAAHAARDTNGCHEGSEWRCPTVAGEQDDDAEGNSHPFNPPGAYVPAAYDPTSGAQLPGTGEWIDHWAANRACSMGYSETARDANGDPVCVPEEHTSHARGLIDLYYSTEVRPPEPPLRLWAILDAEGRLDEFHENNRHPGTTTPPAPYHPGQPDHDVTHARRPDSYP